MAECTKCGAALEENAEFCVGCGAKVEAAEAVEAEVACECEAEAVPEKKSKHIGLILLGLFTFFVSLMLYFKWKDECPEKAEALLKGVLIKASLVPVIGFILFFVLRKEYPEVAKICLITAIVVIAIPVVIAIIYLILMAIITVLALVLGGAASEMLALAPLALLI